MAESGLNSIFGRQIGRYVLLEKLGEGGMATVYNAYDSRLERNVALKVILPSRQSSQLFLERFVREAKSLAQMSHTNIVKVLDYGEENGVPYLVMEYIQGGMLKDVMNQPFPWSQAAAILAPIARALDYVHKQRIVHRDVKPSNILLDDNDEPMLSDFGVVQLLETTETIDLATGVGIGTPDYMSPEQGMGKPTDFRADIYALGVVFYELVTGQKPYTAESPMAVVIKHVTGSFPRPSGAGVAMPQMVEDVIMKAVAKDPEKRFSDMGEFAGALEELACGEKAQERRVRKFLRMKKKKVLEGTRRPALVPALAIMGVILVLLAGGWIFRGALTKMLPGRFLPVAMLQPTQTVTPAAPRPKASSIPTATRPAPTRTAQPTATLAALPGEATPTNEAVTAPTPAEAQTSNLLLTGMPVPVPSEALSQGAIQKIALWGIGGATAAAWTPDGKQIALGTSDAIFIYDASMFERVKFIETHTWVETLIFTGDGQTLIAGLRDGQVLGWDINTLARTMGFKYTRPSDTRLTDTGSSPAKVLAFSLDKDQRYMAIGYENGTINLWDLSRDRSKPAFAMWQPMKVTGLAFSADNRYLYAAKAETEINIWDISTASLLKDKKMTFSSPVSSMVISADGSRMLAGGAGGNVYLIDMTQERTLLSFSYLGAPVTGIALSPDNDRVAVGLNNGKVKVFRTPGSEEISNIQKELYVLEEHPDAITSLAFSPDGQTLFTTSEKASLKTWDTAAGTEKKSLDLNLPRTGHMVFSPDSQWLLATDATNTTTAWSVRDGSIRYTFKGLLPKGRPFSTNGKYLIIAREADNNWEEGQLDIIGFPDGEKIKTLTGYKHDWQVSFSPEGNLLVSGTPKEAYIWDTSTWEKLKIHGGPNDACSQFYTPDSQRLAVIWEAAVIFKYDQRIETLCATVPDFAQPIYLSSDQLHAVYRMQVGSFWAYQMDTDEVTEAKNADRFAPKGQVPDDLLAVSADDSLIAYAKNNKTMVLAANSWSSLTVSRGNYYLQGGALYGDAKLKLSWQDDFQYTAAISPDNKILATGSQFGTISLWAVP